MCLPLQGRALQHLTCLSLKSLLWTLSTFRSRWSKGINIELRATLSPVCPQIDSPNTWGLKGMLLNKC